MQWLKTTMAVEGNGDVFAHESRGSEEIRIGFRGESDEEDIMVGVMGSEVFFDGICGGDAEEGAGYEQFRAFEHHIDQTLEIKEEEGFEFYCGNHSMELNGAPKSDEIVTSVRDLPGQISQLELMSLNHQPIVSDDFTGGSKYNDGIGYSRLYLKRKRDRKDVKQKEYVYRQKKHNDDTIACSMGSSLYKQFEDFLVSSKKYSPADKMLSQLKILAQNPKEDHCFLSLFVGFFSDFRNKNLKKQTDIEDKREIPYPYSLKSSLLDPVEDVKDSYWTDMVIQTVSSDTSPVVNAALGNHVLNPSSLQLNVEDPNKFYRLQSFDYSYDPVVATNGDKISLAELILTFDDAETIPSKLKLNNIFRRFGSLRETETVIYKYSSRARVVFRRSSDAEVAYNSAKIFNIIGSVVKYELGFAPLLTSKAEPNVELENITTDVMLEMQIPQSEIIHEFVQQTDSQILEEKCGEEGLNDVVDIMT